MSRNVIEKGLLFALFVGAVTVVTYSSASDPAAITDPGLPLPPPGPYRSSPQFDQLSAATPLERVEKESEDVPPVGRAPAGHEPLVNAPVASQYSEPGQQIPMSRRYYPHGYPSLGGWQMPVAPQNIYRSGRNYGFPLPAAPQQWVPQGRVVPGRGYPAYPPPYQR